MERGRADDVAAPRPWRTATTAAGLAAVVLGATAGALTVLGGPADFRWLAPTAACAFGATGLVVARRGRPSAATLTMALIGATFGLSALMRCVGLLAVPRGWPAAEVAVWLGLWLFAPAIVATGTVLPLLLPEGRLPSPRWRPVLALGAAAVLTQAAVWATTPYEPGSFPASWSIESPVGVSVSTEPAVLVPWGLLAVSAVVGAMSSLVFRWRRAGRTERQQLKWILVGCVATTGIWTLLQSLDLGFELLTVAYVLPIPVCCAVAALRHRLWDVDLVISRALAVGVVTVLVLAVAAGLVGLLGGLLPPGPAVPALAAALGVVVVLPLYDRVRRHVNHLVHGEDDDPVTALSRLGERLGATAGDADVREVLPRLVARLADLLSTSYVALDLTDGGSAAAGTPPAEVDRIPLRHHDEDVGALVLTRRPRSRREQERLDVLAAQVSVAVHAVLVARALRRARAAATHAREEERRRVRRDLHDGLGPVLAASVLEAETARDLVRDDPERATALLDRMVPRLSGTVDDVRALVHDLRPPSLDELGLEGAVRELVFRFCRPGRAVELDVGPLGDVPPAVDVAAYRIIAEAVANADRHAGARTLRVALRRDGAWLGLEVGDDGRGIGEDTGHGVGLTSMRDRARDLDGELVIARPETGSGTLVRARLPVVAAP